MDANELRLKCLELAVLQARNEGQHQNVNRIVEIQHQFYDVVVGQESEQEPETEPKPTRGRKPRADKSEIFT